MFRREQERERGSSLTAETPANNRIQTMEVAIARVYNWDVVQKRKEKDEEGDTKGKGKETEGPPNG